LGFDGPWIIVAKRGGQSLAPLAIQPTRRFGMVNVTPDDRLSSIARLCGVVATIFGCIILLSGIGCYFYVSVILANVNIGIQRALSSPEFQEQINLVFTVFYVIAAVLVIAWNHFEALFDAPDTAEQVIIGALNLVDYSNSMLPMAA